MGITKFESKEEKINREIKNLREQLPDIDQEIKAGMNRFDMKMNNGATINEDDVRNLFSGLFKKDKVLNEISQKRLENGDNVENHSLEKIFNEAAQEASEIDRFESKN